MGYCTEAQSAAFIEQVPAVEKAMVDNGIILIKYWLNVASTSRPGGSGTASRTRARSGSSPEPT